MYIPKGLNEEDIMSLNYQELKLKVKQVGIKIGQKRSKSDIQQLLINSIKKPNINITRNDDRKDYQKDYYNRITKSRRSTEGFNPDNVGNRASDSPQDNTPLLTKEKYLLEFNSAINGSLHEQEWFQSEINVFHKNIYNLQSHHCEHCKKCWPTIINKSKTKRAILGFY